MRMETKFCSGILARPTTGRLRSTGKLSMRVSFTTADASPFEPASSGMRKGRDGGGGGDVFVHISAVERAGLHYEIESNRGKSPRLTSRSNDCCGPLGHNSAKWLGCPN